MKTKLFAALGVALIITGLASPAFATGGGPPPDNTNEVPFWCGTAPGIKYDPTTTPFVVPEPPAGYEWSLLVLKAGSTGNGGVVNENETFANPVVGSSYVHSSGKQISHAILCKRVKETTTVPETIPTTAPTTIPETVPTVPTTLPTTTTVPQITTTVGVNCAPLCAGQFSPTTTVAETTTTVATTVPVVTTVATTVPAEVIPPVVETVPVAPVEPGLPVTGAMTALELAIGAALVLAGLAALAFSKNVRSIR